MRSMKLFLVITAFRIVLSTQASAQTLNSTPQVDHWSTYQECVATPQALKYRPTLRKTRALDPKKEKVDGMPGGCYLMVLLDRLHSPGWVQIEDGREGVFEYDPKTFLVGKLLRLKECNNDISGYYPFPPPKGEKGDPGLPCDPDKNPKCRGPKGDPGENAVAPTPPSKPKRKFGFMVTGMVWPTDMNSRVANLWEKATEQTPCNFETLTFGLGVTLGRPGKSFWSLNLTTTIFRGSTIYLCSNCGREVRTYTTSDTRMVGVSVGRMERLPLGKLPIELVLEGRIGLDYLFGTANQSVGEIGQPATNLYTVDASELFNSSLVLSAEVNGGVAIKLDKNFLLGITAGVSTYGTFAGKLSLSYQPSDKKK